MISLVAAGCSAARSETDLAQAIPAIESRGRSLQVVIHDLLETAPRGGRVRVCRALAERAVRLETGAPLPLGDVLERLAAQVGTDLAPAARGASGPALPTLRCPGEVGDHLVIGRPPR